MLIGGTACSIAMDEVAIEFRLTKDLDIVLCIEALDGDFAKVFWDFIRDGNYKHQQKSTGRTLFYRFDDPKDETFPFMLELFSRVPDALHLKDDSHLTPITVGDEVLSLSAILLDDDYYFFIQAGKQEIDGLPIVIPVYLIPLKARAWLDLTGRREAGEAVDAKDIRKHRNDVFRLYQAIPLNARIATPDSIKDDLVQFLTLVKGDASLSLKDLGLRSTTLTEVAENLVAIYGLER